MTNGAEKSDQELVLAARAGDRLAFSLLVRRHQEGVKGVARVFFRDSAQAEDISQEVFLRAFRKLSTLRPPYHFGAWVKQIARNMSKNICMRRPKTVPLETVENVLGESPLNLPADREDLAERVSQTIEALSKLSPRLRETARLAYLSCYRQREIGQRLHVPIGTVKRRLWEARRRIQKEVRMSRKGKESGILSVVPAIDIKEVTGVSMRVPIRGYGSIFGSVLEIGDVEVSKFFDYPGGVLTLTIRSEVMGKVNIFGHECYEVLLTHSDCDPPEPNALEYFEISEKGIEWMLEVIADEVYPRLEHKGEEEMAPIFEGTDQKSENKMTRVVKLKIGDRDYGQCLVVLERWENGTPCERFYTAEGRQVLHRRYVGPEAPGSRIYDYKKLPVEPNVVIENKEYRLWYDTVLVEPR